MSIFSRATPWFFLRCASPSSVLGTLPVARTTHMEAARRDRDEATTERSAITTRQHHRTWQGSRVLGRYAHAIAPPPWQDFHQPCWCPGYYPTTSRTGLGYRLQRDPKQQEAARSVRRQLAASSRIGARARGLFNQLLSACRVRRTPWSCRTMCSSAAAARTHSLSSATSSLRDGDALHRDVRRGQKSADQSSQRPCAPPHPPPHAAARSSPSSPCRPTTSRLITGATGPRGTSRRYWGRIDEEAARTLCGNSRSAGTAPMLRGCSRRRSTSSLRAGRAQRPRRRHASRCRRQVRVHRVRRDACVDGAHLSTAGFVVGR